jgi:hypothetical protein
MGSVRCPAVLALSDRLYADFRAGRTFGFTTLCEVRGDDIFDSSGIHRRMFYSCQP